MRCKICQFIILVTTFVLLNCFTVLGYTGKGTKNNPYIVTTETDLRTVIMDLEKQTTWVYIAVNSDMTLTKSIVVDGGKYRIYAKGSGRTIRRSSNTTHEINESGNPKYCMRLLNKAEVVVGYNATNYVLKLGGNKDAFSSKFPSSGWFNINSGTKLIIGEKAHLTNAINNENQEYGSVVRCLGDLVVNGEISKCEGMNGGAIKAWGGNIKINSGAKIHNCKSGSEGGAIFVSQGGYIEMNGGAIYQCESQEEGGAIFIGESSIGDILAGNIYNNLSNKSAGGVFSGYGATLYVGESGKSGPNIYNNRALGSGGGIRCNGGVTEYAGGTTFFNSGHIYNNVSGNLGGGIACGAAGSKNYSKIKIENMHIENNTSQDSGGGLWLPENAVGTNTTEVIIQNTHLTGNKSNANGGGILINNSVVATNLYINYNEATVNGGAIFIANTGKFHYKGEQIIENVAKGNGNGIYVRGQFIISEKGQISSTNEVYLSSGTYIEVRGVVIGNNYLNASIISAVTANGTKLVKVNYGNANSESELYYQGNANSEYNNQAVKKRYVCNNLKSNQLLRAGKYVTGIGDEWIIISEEYTVEYEKNAKNNVENMPESQKAYWKEGIGIDNSNITQTGYILDESKHWNLKKDGKGTVFKPGSLYIPNGNIVLYAQWIQVSPSELFIDTSDRYYVVGQNIELTPEELLKKVHVTDDLNTGCSYVVKIVVISEYDGDVIAQGNDLKSHEYIDTSKENHYVIDIIASDEKGKLYKESNLDIYVLQGNNIVNMVRFISRDYMYTLAINSKWNNRLKNTLEKSLYKEKSDKKIYLDKDDIKKIKERVKGNNYIISKEMNRDLVESW